MFMLAFESGKWGWEIDWQEIEDEGSLQICNIIWIFNIIFNGADIMVYYGIFCYKLYSKLVIKLLVLTSQEEF